MNEFNSKGSGGAGSRPGGGSGPPPRPPQPPANPVQPGRALTAEAHPPNMGARLWTASPLGPWAGDNRSIGILDTKGPHR